MKSCRVYTTSGASWTTSINGTDESIKEYFIGQSFNMARYPDECMEKACRVEILKDYTIEDQDGSFTVEMTEESPHTAMLAFMPKREGSHCEPFRLFKVVDEVFYYNVRGKDCHGLYVNDVLMLKLTE